jgi:hypothetical protein
MTQEWPNETATVGPNEVAKSVSYTQVDRPAN